MIRIQKKYDRIPVKWQETIGLQKLSVKKGITNKIKSLK